MADEVRIPSDPGVVLAGTLRTPTRPGPFPTILLIGGSGPGQRGGLSPLMERLLGDGIAVLEYDKRGVGQSTGDFVDSLRNMETDAAAAVRYLRSRSNIDANRIALIGHSQGGAVAPAVAAKDPGIAAVVMLAGPAAPVKPGKVNLIIMKEMLAKAGAAPAAIQQVAEASDRLFEAQARKAPLSEIVPLQEAVIQGFIACKFTRPQAEGALVTLNSIVVEAWNARFDRTLASLRTPVLALYASEDEHVSTPDELPAAKAALAANPDAKVVEIADVNHSFHRVKKAGDLKSDQGTMVSEVIEMVGDWLTARLQPAKAKTASPNWPAQRKGPEDRSSGPSL
ncbi:MAG: alpha/beta fold hydrolase [Pseudomonadota bacterium]|nr:alpha/beta fold hydrolase [Pseudomonadota bacterium]